MLDDRDSEEVRNFMPQLGKQPLSILFKWLIVLNASGNHFKDLNWYTSGILLYYI